SNSIIGYGLGRALESLNRFEEAFITMASANKARRNAAGAFSRQQFDQRLLLLKQIFTRDFFTARNQWGYQSDVPVFVVGLPRSGTTLTEQIISSHPNCFGGGELASLTDLATGTPDRIGSTKRLWPDSATLLSASHVEQLGREYMVRVLGLADGNYRRIVDKQPLNFWHLGLVALALPQAKVIHCVRDVRDNGLSIFAQNFNAQQKWSTDLSDIAHYWRGYRTIMEHWKSVTDLEILDVQYEETVGDLEYQARRILKFLDVPWAPGVLEFHKNRRAVQTPSRWQVRQPIYSTSKSKWKLYERHLGPLISAAAEQGRSL
ncbi:MAG: sulfotransferase, partial [Cyanobacteria bacterium P01_H01_bin.15]